MTIITKKTLEEVNKGAVQYQYALSPNRNNNFFAYSTGKTDEEAFENFASLLEEELDSRDYSGVCEVKRSDQHQDKGLVTLIGRVISVKSLIGLM